ncbi:LysR substrate-binding domain-containing protein [Sulfitobacter sp.]|uniref:LysR substrate-binding domain-containing protein n=1 Tax=Sulfitobacter sp. TaxID=1903071 RepID=UPI00300198C2
MCASAGYLEAHGIPQKPDDLAHHNVLAFTGNSGLHERRYQDAEGQHDQVGWSGKFKSDSGDILCRAALEAVGIAILPIFYVAEHIKNQELQAVLSDYVTPPKRAIYAVFQPTRFQSTRQRFFVDHLVSTCKQLPWES